MKHLKEGTPQKTVDDAFWKYDEDQSSCLDYDEFKKLAFSNELGTHVDQEGENDIGILRN